MVYNIDMDQIRQTINDTVSSDDFGQQIDFGDTPQVLLTDPNDHGTQAQNHKAAHELSKAHAAKVGSLNGISWDAVDA